MAGLTLSNSGIFLAVRTTADLNKLSLWLQPPCCHSGYARDNVIQPIRRGCGTSRDGGDSGCLRHPAAPGFVSFSYAMVSCPLVMLWFRVL